MSKEPGAVLITGCSSGIGRETARHLRAGARAIETAITARRPRTRYKVTASARLAIAQRKLVTDRAWDAMMRTQFPSPDRG